jgi:hypothetical protein
MVKVIEDMIKEKQEAMLKLENEILKLESMYVCPEIAIETRVELYEVFKGKLNKNHIEQSQRHRVIWNARAAYYNEQLEEFDEEYELLGDEDKKSYFHKYFEIYKLERRHTMLPEYQTNLIQNQSTLTQHQSCPNLLINLSQL